MKVQIPKRTQPQGTVLLVTLFIAFLFGSFLCYYLGLVQSHKSLITRSQAWNAAMGMAEAGAEEALAQLNPGAPQPFFNLSTNGWGPPVSGLYGPVARSLTGGSYSTVYTTDPYPIIYSTGYVTIGVMSATLARTIRVCTTNVPLFNAGMGAISNINFAGNGVYVDSFNSMNPNLSTNGRYDPTKASTNGDVGSVYGLVNVANGNINGKLLLGPVATDSISSNGQITGGVYYDFNTEFEDVVLPETTWLPVTPTSMVIGTNTFQYVFSGSGGDYVIGALSGSIYVDTNTTVRLLIQKSFNTGNIEVASNGANSGHLTIYMNGPSFSVTGSTWVDGGNAMNLSYYGLPSNTQINFSGNASFTGTIYAPEAFYKLGGGGSGYYNFVGAVFARQIMVNGHYSFHFDENLLTAGPIKGFVARSWSEL
jgi:hypothetical protein